MMTRKELINTVEYFNEIPLFRYIEINLLDFCNRACSFCPVSYEKNSRNYMSHNTFNLIVNELAEINFSGLFIISGFCEPLLHSELQLFLDELKTKIPNATTLINTNGDFLKEDNINNILDKVDYLSISIYDGEDRYNFFNDIRNNLKEKEKLQLRKRYMNFDKNNRAGYFNMKKELPLNKPCYYPFYFIDVGWNGDILFCPNNFEEENKIGNIHNMSLIEAWNKMNDIRNNMLNKGRIDIPCHKCDVKGDNEGEKYYEVWKESLEYKKNRKT